MKNPMDDLWNKLPRKTRWIRMWVELIICVALMIPDYVVVGSIPVIGDAWDIVVMVVLTILFWNVSAGVMLAEFIPLVDLLPLELVPWANKYMRKKKGKK